MGTKYPNFYSYHFQENDSSRVFDCDEHNLKVLNYEDTSSVISHEW